MIVDSRNEFCNATLLNTGGAGTYLLGDQIDLGTAAAPAPLGTGDTLYLVIAVQTTITAGAGGTVSFTLASDDTANIATNGTATVHFSTPARTVGAGIPAGTVLAVVELPRTGTYERYLGILQTTGVAAVTAGRIDAFLTNDPSAWGAFDSPFHL